MVSLKKGMSSVILPYLLTLTLSIQSGKGSPVSGPQWEASTVAPPPSNNSLQALRTLQEGQTLKLADAEVWLTETVVVDASNVGIEGALETTRMRCPDQGGAFVVRGRNVTLRRLEITRCVNGSALTVGNQDDSIVCGEDGQLACDSKSSGRNWRSEVNVDSCFFTNNKNSDGPAVFARNAQLKIVNTTFVKNHATTCGAVHLVSSNLTMKNCRFESNAAEGGGALYAEESEVTLRSISFAKNSATLVGGAVYLLRSRGAAIDVDFANNTARKAGALRVESSTSKLKNVSFSGNSARSMGGAISLWKGEATVKDANFTDNMSAKGNFRISESNVTIENAVFVRNSAKSLGGALLLRMAEAAVKHVRFLRNKADKGGAISVDDSTAVLEDVVAIENSASTLGGAFYLWLSTASIKRTDFINNTANKGGGLWLQESDATAEGVTFTGNSAHTFGGAFDMWMSTASVADAELLRNTADKGAALYALESSVTMKDVLVAENFAESLGGAFAVGLSNATVKAVRFADNSAAKGGALSVQDSNVEVQKSEFSNNVALHGGGASLDDRAVLDVKSSTFNNNSARRGGAVHSTSSTCSMMLSDVVFSGNTADEGGAVCMENKARIQSLFRDEQRNLFEGNAAMNGGALFCDNCVLDFQSQTEFVGNVASDSGGGIYLKATRNATFACVRSHRNVASFGGALAVVGCGALSLGDSSKWMSSFTNNIAVDGGALHAHCSDVQHGVYKIENSRFESNRAIEASDMLNIGDVPALKRWLEGSEGSSLRHAWSSLDCARRACGRGGGLFLDLAHATMEESSSESRNNFPELKSQQRGGGNFRRQCNEAAHDDPGCSILSYDRIHMIGNSALSAGGGMFMSGSEDPFSYCAKKNSRNGEDGAQWNSSTCFALAGNDISREGYGPDFATDAASLHWRNVGARLTDLRSGGLLSVMPGSDNADDALKSGLLVDVRDALNQTITVGPDSSLLVVLLSRWIIGAASYRAQKGVVHVNSTTILGVSVNDTLVVQTDDGRDISTELHFSTSPCERGEIEDASGHRCRRCAAHLYTLSSRDGCRQCEEHAFCNKTTGLVPEEGYWHSTPFSPLMRRCPVKEACSSDNRIEKLLDYYDDFHFIRAAIEELESSRKNITVLHYDAYPQCAEGYSGILCGACTAGYGHTSNGECELCSQSLATTRLLTGLITLLVFAVISVKLFLEMLGVWKDVAFELLQQAREVRGVLDTRTQHTPSISLSSTRGAESTRSVEAARNDSAEEVLPLEKEMAEIVPAKDEGGPSLETSNNGVRPPMTLPRTKKSIEEPQCEAANTNEVSIEAREASGMLAETYNILFNYMQLNSIAFFLEIDWKGPLTNLLYLQTLVGRIFKIGLHPLDCCFSDRDKDAGIPNSFAVLLLRTAFPFFTVGVHVVFVQLWARLREERKLSKYEIDFIPPVKLVFFMVYFSYCIDLISDLLGVMNCVHLNPALPDHPYSDYEILEEHYVWAHDTSVTCFEGGHFWLVIFATIGLVASLAVIVSIIYVLYDGQRRDLLKDPKFRLNYGFLFLKYRPKGLALYWESVITARRMLLAAVAVYSQARDTTNAEIGLLAIVVFTAIALQEIVKPFDQEDSKAIFPAYAGSILKRFGAHKQRERWIKFNQHVSLNGLEAASLFMSLSLFLTAMSINGNEASSIQGTILVSVCFFLNVMFFAFMLYRIWYGFHCYLDVTARDRPTKFQGKDDPEEDSSTWLFMKVWVLYLKPKAKRDAQDVESTDSVDLC